MNLAPTVTTELQQELRSGEQLLWSGRPKQGLMLRGSDVFLIPFSLLWGGFAFYWEAIVLSHDTPFFFKLWGIPFVIVGFYITIGRFFQDAYVRSKTSYGVTNERAIIVSGFISRNVKSVSLRNLNEIDVQRHRDGSGTITFGPSQPFASWYRGLAWPSMGRNVPPAFERIPNISHVQELIAQGQQAR